MTQRLTELDFCILLYIFFLRLCDLLSFPQKTLQFELLKKKRTKIFKTPHWGLLNHMWRRYVNNLLPAELSRVIHVGTGLDVAFVWVIDSGGSRVCSSQDEYKTI